ncbi:MAG: hypothetical protein NUW12_09550 [Firmicutes bacterium]|nr:hypothetical protein [Bacillota bacterium]
MTSSGQLLALSVWLWEDVTIAMEILLSQKEVRRLYVIERVV